MLLAGETPPARPPMPEPILVETISDIDAPKGGEFEMEINTSYMRSRKGGAYQLEFGPELEWLVTDQLGAMLELFGGREADANAPSTFRFGVSAGLSWKLLQDFPHDFHLQAEVRGRFPTDLSTTEPGESALPVSFDLLSGLRIDRWTTRNSIGASVGRTPAHVPIQGSAVLLTGFDRSQRHGFWGIEATADGAKVAPFALALDLVPDLGAAGLPFRIGLVGSYTFAAPVTLPSWGVFLRIFFESAREVEFDRGSLRR